MKDLMTLGKSIEEQYQDDVILQDKLEGFADDFNKQNFKKKEDGIDENREEEIDIKDEDWHKQLVREAKARIVKKRLEEIL